VQTVRQPLHLPELADEGFGDRSVSREATALHGELVLPPMRMIPADLFSAPGLRSDDLTAIRDVLAAYDHTNAMAMVVFSALGDHLEWRARRDAQPLEPGPVPPAPRTKLPRLLGLIDMDAGTAALVVALNGFGTRRPGAVLASMYPHLAHWPSYLSFACLLLAPLDADGRLAIAIQQGRRAARSRADRLPVGLAGPAALPPGWRTSPTLILYAQARPPMAIVCHSTQIPAAPARRFWASRPGGTPRLGSRGTSSRALPAHRGCQAQPFSNIEGSDDLN
jgi:hypothetical protein